MRRPVPVLLALALAAARPVCAEPARYLLEAGRSVVGFEADFTQGGRIEGRMPVVEADLILDFDRVAASRIRVTLDAARARTGIPFATAALAAPEVLSTRAHPLIRFESSRVRPAGEGAVVEGLLTVRGVTRPVVLDAQLYRQRGTEPGERDRLSILLTGRVSRAEYGAAGWAGTVGDEVRLRILARIRRAG